MIPIVEIPTLVSHYASYYRDLFTEAGYAHFQRYLSGLLVCENKTVSQINQAFIVEPRDQSTLNRFLTQGRYEVSALNERRLSQLQAHPDTCMRDKGKSRGVLGIDDTLLTHVGGCFDQIHRLWDHANNRYELAHNLVNLYYSDPHTDYPVDFELWEPPDLVRIEQGLVEQGIGLKAAKFSLKQSDPAKWRKYLLGVLSRKAKKDWELNSLYRNKVIIAMELLTRFFERYPDHDLPVAFDSWFTTPQMCQYIDQQLNRSYVGALKVDKAELILGRKSKVKLAEFIDQLTTGHKQGKKPLFRYLEVKRKDKTRGYFVYCKTHRLKNYGKVRLLISFQTADLSDSPKVYISNRLDWRDTTICRIYNYRWPVEPFHQQAKEQGLDQYQIRDFQAIQKHVAFVLIVFSFLTMARKDPELLSKLQLSTDATEESLAFWNRLIRAQTLLTLIQWVKVALEQGMAWDKITQPILQAFA